MRLQREVEGEGGIGKARPAAMTKWYHRAECMRRVKGTSVGQDEEFRNLAGITNNKGNETNHDDCLNYPSSA